MTETLIDPHDKFFQGTFSRKKVARDFIKHYLPADVVSLLDVDSLEISKDSFIDADLKRHFSDLLYKVALQDQSKQPFYIYLLFDHKSYMDKWVAFQLLVYMIRIWELSFKQQRAIRKKQPKGKKDRWYLPPIFPLVVYHGTDRWTASTEFVDLFDNLPKALRPYMPNYQYWLCDLSSYDDEDIKGYVILQVGLLLLKYIYAKEFGDRLPEIAGLLHKLSDKQTALEYLETLIRYVSSGAKHLTEEQLVEAVNKIFKEGGDMMPTLAEQWMERGRVEGLEKGLKKGQATLAQVISHILNTRFVELSHGVYIKELSQLSLSVLEHLSQLVINVPSLAEFEAVLQKYLVENKQANRQNELEHNGGGG